MYFEAVLFDMDGTLIKTEAEYRYKVVGETLDELGVIYENHNAMKKYIDKFWFCENRDKTIKEHFKLEHVVFWKKFREIDNKNISLREKLTRPYDDVGFIKKIREKGYKTGIVTGATVPIAQIEISMLGKENFDEIVIANYMNKRKPKPDPESLEECLRNMGASPEYAIYVGNSDEDILIARNAHVLDVLIDRGEYEIEGIMPSVKIKTLYGLRQLLDI